MESTGVKEEGKASTDAVTDSGTAVASTEERSAPVQQKPVRELKVEDALLYLDQVKMEFSDKPQIYNEFLEIMKNFKAQTINTPGVIDAVKNLFKGYNKLILGFNTFLPEGEGFKIELTEEEENTPYPGNNPNYHTSGVGGSSSDNTGGGQMMTPNQGSGGDGVAQSGDAGGEAKPPQQMQQQHAISYVTTIRNRFANEPDTYRAFLRILHTYQKEQKGIKDVLEQVSILFADHPDLLMEFTYFLPDAVQDQAKERLNRAARESEMRRRMVQAQQQQQAAMAGNKRNQAGVRKHQQYLAHQQMLHQQAQQQQQMAQRKRMRGRDSKEPQLSHISTTAERRFFDNVKDLLLSTSRDGWAEFVKHLDLFINDAITKKDLLLFAQDIFGPHGADYFTELKKLMNARVDYDGHGSDNFYAIPTSEIDFQQCRKCTPSYRALPKDYPKPVCTERSEMEASVLNDEWITYPFSAEEGGGNFKHMAKNSHEEELFKCEEDRFEIDMIIDSNYCTIRILEPIAEEIMNIKALEEAGEKSGNQPRFSLQLEKRNLTCIHLNAISRVYGEHGPEILELLHKNPAGTIPVLLKRLKQKDMEWRKARQDLNAKWKETIERNYERSFDHRSYYFKKQDKRFYDPKVLIADMKDIDDATVTNSTGTGGLEVNDGALPGISNRKNVESVMPNITGIDPQINLSFKARHHSIHKDIYNLLCSFAEVQNIPPSDKERISFLWRDLLRVFFNIPVRYLYDDGITGASVFSNLSNAKASKETAAKTIRKMNEKEGIVSTTEGEGGMDVAEGDTGSAESTADGANDTNSATSVSETTAKSGSASAADLDAHSSDSSEAWVTGTTVITPYGSGVVLEYRPEDGIYAVGLKYGTAYCKGYTIIGAEELSGNALDAIGVQDGSNTKEGVDVVFDQVLATLESFNGTATSYAPGTQPKETGRAASNRSRMPTSSNGNNPNTTQVQVAEPDRVLYSTSIGYTFIRMYHTIFTRLAAAKELSEAMREQRIGTVHSGVGSGTATVFSPKTGDIDGVADIDGDTTGGRTQNGMKRGEVTAAVTVNVSAPAPAPAPKSSKSTSKRSARGKKGTDAVSSQESNASNKSKKVSILAPLQTTNNTAASSAPMIDGKKHPLSYMDAVDDEATMVSGNTKAYGGYFSYLSQLDSLLDGSIDSARYEETCRELLGNKSYMLFTMDKVVQQCLKTLQQMANEENFNKLVGLFVYHRNKAGAFKMQKKLCENSGNFNFINASNQGTSSVANIQQVTSIIQTSGVDPLSYAIHAGKLQEHISDNNGELYRLQYMANSDDNCIGVGYNVVSCQLLGNLATDEARLNAAKGPPAKGAEGNQEVGMDVA